MLAAPPLRPASSSALLGQQRALEESGGTNTQTTVGNQLVKGRGEQVEVSTKAGVSGRPGAPKLKPKLPGQMDKALLLSGASALGRWREGLCLWATSKNVMD